MRFDSQFARMNCQIFSCGLSSGARGGSGRSEMFLGALRSLRRDGAACPRCCKRAARGQRRLRARGIPRRTGRLIGCVDRGWLGDASLVPELRIFAAVVVIH